MIEPAGPRPLPTPSDTERWLAADRKARPARLDGLRARLSQEGVDAYFGIRPENSRYLTGMELGFGEEKVAGNSGQFFVSRDEAVVLADSRYTVQVREECPDARMEQVYNDLVSRWPELLAGLKGVGGNGVKRLAVEAGFVPFAMWQRLAAASPDVELVPAEGWVEALRATKEPSELERVAAACAVADQALTRLLPNIIPGATEQELALQLEWEMRTSGADGLAFDVACLFGERAALPHGSPGKRPISAGNVLLFDFGAQVGGYRSDMTRTLFVGGPTNRDLEIYGLVKQAQQAAFDALSAAVESGSRPSGPEIDAVSRQVIIDAGYGDHFGHGLGHGIGLNTHELPGLGKSAAGTPLPSPTVFSVEPGVYLDGETGVRIEDLVIYDPDAGRLERITSFPREVTVVGA
jgi:Xaa-Pro aminopeptidase